MKRKIYREDIIKTGLRLMFLNGYNATGIKDITASINIPKGSFYNHFKSKEEFGLEVLQYYCDNGTAMHQKALLESELPPLNRLKTFYEDLVKGYSGGTMEYKLGCIMSNFAQELADVNENFRQVLDTEFNKCEAIIVQCLNEAKAQTEINSTLNNSQIGAFILNSWHGALMRMKATANAKPLNDFLDVIFNQVLVPQ